MSLEPSLTFQLADIPDKSSFFFSNDEGGNLSLPYILSKLFDKSTRECTSGGWSDEEAELNRLGACFQGTGPDPANWLQLLPDMSLYLSDKRFVRDKDCGHGRLDGWDTDNR